VFGSDNVTTITKKGNTITIAPPGKNNNKVITKDGDTITFDTYFGPFDGNDNSCIRNYGNGVNEQY
jgi:hypothetical protein